MSNKLSSFLMIFGVILIISITGCGSDSAESGESGEDGPIQVQLGHTLTENSSWQTGAEHFAERIEEMTDGRYQVQIFPNGQLASGNQQKAIEMLRQGSYDVDITSSLIWSGFDEELNITALPWMLPTFEDVEEVTQGDGGQLLLDVLSENGVTPVAIGETGYRQMLSNGHQIKTPEDLANLKLRVPGTPIFLDLYNALGADPIQMDFTEVFTGLQQGTIDGMEGVVDVVNTNNFYEVLDYMSVNNYNFDFFFFTFSNDFYNSLSEEDKEIFMEAGKEATREATDYAREANEEALDFLESELEIFEPSEEQINEFKEAAAPVYEEYKETFSPELREAFNYPE